DAQARGVVAWAYPGALAATHAGQGFDRRAGFSGDLRDLPILVLDIGLGKQVCVDLAQRRARYFTVRGAHPVLVEDIEKDELLNPGVCRGAPPPSRGLA